MRTVLLIAATCIVVAVAKEFRGCRMVSSEELPLEQCSLPYNLGNFQGYHGCNSSVLVGRPKTLSDVQEMVLCFEQVKAVGVGHSWWEEQFCSGDDETALNIVMTELNSTLMFIENPINPKQFGGKEPPVDFPIHVDENAQVVTVAAGIPQRALLDYLAEYRYGKEPNGWTLQAFSYFIDQTIGGAVATGTHGSSLLHGSLSSQLKSLHLMLANGTIIDINQESNPHLFKASGVSVGRLGIIIDLTFQIVPQQHVIRLVEDLNLLEFAEQVKAIQDQYNSAMASGQEDKAFDALMKLDETNVFWHPIVDEVWKITFVTVNSIGNTKHDSSTDVMQEDVSPEKSLPPTDTLYCISQIDNRTVFGQKIKKFKVEPNEQILENWMAWGNYYPNAMKGVVAPGVHEASKSYITMTERQNAIQGSGYPYEQFEAAIPISIAGDCLMTLNTLVYSKNLSKGFRAPPLIRFLKREDFYLSPSNAHHVMYINIEDHLSLSSGSQNKEFEQVLNHLLGQCKARLHWGKAGWPTHRPCFDGAEDFPESWCDFGCAVDELDPKGKFRSQSTVWRWSASRDGYPVEFSSCCSSQGFLYNQCVCERTPIC